MIIGRSLGRKSRPPKAVPGEVACRMESIVRGPICQRCARPIVPKAWKYRVDVARIAEFVHECALEGGDNLLAFTVREMAVELHRQWPSDRFSRDLEAATNHGIRVIANTITHITWHNGPVENVRARRYEGYGLNGRRVLPQMEKWIVRHAQNGLFSRLKAANHLRYDGAWPPPAGRVLPFLHGLISPS